MTTPCTPPRGFRTRHAAGIQRARPIPRGTPALIIETTEVIECRFSEVTEAMALAEGEDESLEGWRAGHREYFERAGGFSPDMNVVWERFVLVEDLNSGDVEE